MKTFFRFIANTVLFTVGFLAFCYLVGEPTEEVTMSGFMILFTKAIAGFVIYICFQLGLLINPNMREEIENEEV